MLGWWRRRRWRRLRAQPFPPSWVAIVERNVPFVRRLPEADRRELEGHVLVFLAEKSFEGCGGLELDDEVRVTIAAQACVLLLHREADYFPRVSSVLVYPSGYVTPDEEELPDGTVVAGEDLRDGESWDSGAVVLAWDASLAGAVGPRDGDNVILHEFAHQLDQASGEADGLPPLPRRSMYRTWAEVCAREFAALERAAERGRPTVLDPYGAEHPAEFFAVATEAFFERSGELRRRHPELYALLREYYCQDPAELEG
ncbi:MAG: zinc-dependent peptidase [Planctomycetes bacterium]|nr:zinc-dependent peptidase [Planctomycetota bacterium]